MGSTKMTEREKQFRKSARDELRKAGLLPPTKKPLNRKKFVEEAKSMFGQGIEPDYLLWALTEMMNHCGANYQFDLEAVGAAKVIQLAKRRMDFEQEQKAKGRTEWTIGELCDALMDVYKA